MDADISANDLKKLAQKLEGMTGVQKDEFIDKCAKELAARFLRRAIKRTPVGKKPKFEGRKNVKVQGASGKSRSFMTSDYVRYQRYWQGYTGGTLRRGWTGDENKDPAEYANTLRTEKSGNVYKVEIKNSEEYASYVEYGHRQTPGRYVPALGKSLKRSWVEGKFMMTKSGKDIQSIAPALLAKRFEEKLKEAFK